MKEATWLGDGLYLGEVYTQESGSEKGAEYIVTDVSATGFSVERIQKLEEQRSRGEDVFMVETTHGIMAGTYRRPKKMTPRKGRGSNYTKPKKRRK